jgi:hypothetical protein
MSFEMMNCLPTNLTDSSQCVRHTIHLTISPDGYEVSFVINPHLISSHIFNVTENSEKLPN